ncbi:MAG: transporter [Lachnospiraceae bacterium]|jgi:cytochrome bd-type quinol oxidase subunit 2|nr:transporter [Lachnospiraceae bacterium]
MEFLYRMCIALSTGCIIGFLAGGVKLALHKKEYPQKKIESTKRLMSRFAATLKYVTFLLLVLGFIWCCYFLVLGIAQPEQSDYANNMAELIVAVLTVISIIFAFVEFLRRADSDGA